MYNQVLAIFKKAPRSLSLPAVFAQAKHSAPNARQSFAEVTGYSLYTPIQFEVSGLGSTRTGALPKKGKAVRNVRGPDEDHGDRAGGVVSRLLTTTQTVQRVAGAIRTRVCRFQGFL